MFGYALTAVRKKFKASEVFRDASGQAWIVYHAWGDRVGYPDGKRTIRLRMKLPNRRLTRAEWEAFLPGRPYEPAC